MKDIDVSGKRVFLRGDIDVDVEGIESRVSTSLKFRGASESLEIDVRLRNLKPTVDYLLERSPKQIVIAGHIGRPEKRNPDLSTERLIPVLESILDQKVHFQAEITNDKFQITKDERIILLENLRFWEGEEKNDPEFAKQLASLADVYINEAFGVSHREHASIVGVPALLPHAAGLHLEEEVNQLTKLIKNPQRPMVAIIGGAKLETKVPVIDAMANVADFVLVGGLIAKELKVESGKWKVGGNVVIAELTEDTKDIDEDSIKKFREIIKTARTVVWNGPVGYFEGGFERGTMAIAQAVIDSGAFSVIGGGETTEFLGSKGLLNKFGFVSSGGGAMLEYLSGKELPGIKALA